MSHHQEYCRAFFPRFKCSIVNYSSYLVVEYDYDNLNVCQNHQNHCNCSNENFIRIPGIVFFWPVLIKFQLFQDVYDVQIFRTWTIKTKHKIKKNPINRNEMNAKKKFQISKHSTCLLVHFHYSFLLFVCLFVFFLLCNNENC